MRGCFALSAYQRYVPFDPGLAMKSKFLTERMAYFLAGMLVSEEQVVTKDRNLKIAPVRYNHGTAGNNIDLNEHFEFVKEMGESVGGNTIMTAAIRGTPLMAGKKYMPGFSTFFRVTTLGDYRELIDPLGDALEKSAWSVRRAFLVGIFDGRCSPDIDTKTHHFRMLTVDCVSDDIGAFLAEMIEREGFEKNYNTSRDRKEGGRPRNPQLRISKSDPIRFMEKVGLVSPRRVTKIELACRHLYDNVTIEYDSDVLVGLKTIHVS